MATTILLDTFAAADGTSIADHSPENAPAGWAWESINGTPEIQGNALVSANASSPYYSAAQMPIGGAGSSPVSTPLILRFVGKASGVNAKQNYGHGVSLTIGGQLIALTMYYTATGGGDLKANVYTAFGGTLESAPLAESADHTLELLLSGSDMTLTVDGSVVGTASVSVAGNLESCSILVVGGTSYISEFSLISTAAPPAYPAGLPSVLAAKSRTQPANFRVIGSRRGPGYTQAVGTETPVFWDVTFRFTRTQAKTFIDWFTGTLKRGVLEFTMELRTEFGMVEHVCRFLPDTLLPATDTGEVWTYTATIMSRGEIIPQWYLDYADDIIPIVNWDGTLETDPLWANVARLVQFSDASTGDTFKDWKTNEAGNTYSDGGVEAYVTRTTSPSFGDAPSMRWTYQATASFTNKILRFPASSRHAIPASTDFTVEAWIRAPRAGTDGQGWITIARSYTTTTASNAADWEFILQQGSTWSPSGGWSFVPGFVTSNGILIRATNTNGVTNSQWHHVAVSRQGTDWRVFLNGVSTAVVTPMGATTGFPGPYGNSSSKLSLMGREDSNGSGVPNCYGFGSGSMAGPDAAYDAHLGAFRLTVGVARYWANFTPEIRQFVTR